MPEAFDGVVLHNPAVLERAAANSLCGFNPGAALATAVGVLIAVPAMLSVVWIASRSQGWYERGAAGKGAVLKPASREA